jgi:hypothetical protein
MLNNYATRRYRFTSTLRQNLATTLYYCRPKFGRYSISDVSVWQILFVMGRNWAKSCDKKLFLQHGVAADSSAESVIWCYLCDIRRMNPPLHHVAKIA